jgi:hypothetical protein
MLLLATQESFDNPLRRTTDAALFSSDGSSQPVPMGSDESEEEDDTDKLDIHKLVRELLLVGLRLLCCV